MVMDLLRYEVINPLHGVKEKPDIFRKGPLTFGAVGFSTSHVAMGTLRAPRVPAPHVPARRPMSSITTHPDQASSKPLMNSQMDSLLLLVI